MVDKFSEYRIGVSEDGSTPLLVNHRGEVMSGIKSMNVDWDHDGFALVTVQLIVGNSGDTWPPGVRNDGG